MKSKGFTLVELLVVIAIIGLLSTIAVVGLNSSGVNARNAQRKANLVQISKALELYYNDNSGYPIAGGPGAFNGYCINLGSHPDDDSVSPSWIPGLTPKYMVKLPHDIDTSKKVNLSASCQATANRSCYGYASNGTEYKILANCLPEGPLASIIADPMGVADGSAYQIYTPGAAAW